MTKLFSYILLFCFSLVSLVSCVSKKPSDPVIVTKTKTIKEIVKDTVFTVEADSSFYKAYIDCRDGKPILIDKSFKAPLKTSETLIKPTSQKGKYLKKPSVNLSDNGVLSVNCEAEAQKLFASWKQTYINEQEPVIVPKTTEVYKESLAPWYVKVQLWAGRLLLLILGIAAVIEVYNLIKKK